MKNASVKLIVLGIIPLIMSACSTLGRTTPKTRLPSRPAMERVEVLEETCTKIAGRIFCMVDMDANTRANEALKNHIIKLENEPVWEK